MYEAVTVPVLIPCRQQEAEGRATFLTRSRKQVFVRRFSDAELRAENAAWRKEVLNDPHQAKELLRLWEAISAAQRHPDLRELVEQVRAARKAEPDKPERVLSERLSDMLALVRLVLWWNEKERRFLPALYCAGGIPDAAFVRLLLSVAAGKKALGLRVCPHCSTLFLQGRPDQEYCSIRCREAYRVARWRGKQKKSRGKKSPRKRG